jgi:hypothetical protein
VKFQQSESVFAGMTVPTLQTALANAQAALIALQLGQQVVTLSYGEGNGTKHTQFKATNPGALVQLINELKACLGMSDRARRGLRISF